MQNNPFYVHPGNDFGAQLTGLGQTIGEYGKVKRQRDEMAKKEARFVEVKQAMTEALASNDPTKIAQVAIDYPEAQQTMLAAWKTKNEGTKQNLKDSTMRILSGESPERVLNERIAMVEAAGGDATQSRQELEVYRSDPAGYQQKVLNGAAWLYPEEVLARQKAIGGEKTTYQQGTGGMAGYVFDPTTGIYKKAPNAPGSAGGADIKPTANMQDWQEYNRLKTTDPEGAKAFGQKVGFVSKEGRELSVHMQKRLSTATDTAIDSEANADRLDGLANQVEAAGFEGGLFKGSWREKYKDLSGSQDAITDLRKRYAAIRGSQVVNNLPPGAASDKDIELALAGFPSDNAPASQIASFLRGTAKLERQRAAMESFKAEYISSNGSEKGLLSAWKQRIKQDDEAAKNRPISEYSDEELMEAAKGGGA